MPDLGVAAVADDPGFTITYENLLKKSWSRPILLARVAAVAAAVVPLSKFELICIAKTVSRYRIPTTS